MFDSRLYPQGIKGFRSRWVNGVLVVTNGNGVVVQRFDPLAAYAVAASNIVPVSGKCTIADEYASGPFHKTRFTLTLTGANDLDTADGADHGAGIKIADFPAGKVFVLGAQAGATVKVNDAFGGNPNDTFFVGVGSVVCADDADLTTTEQDLVAKTTLDTVGNTVLSLPWTEGSPAGAAPGVYSALDVCVNVVTLNANITKGATFAFTGYIDLTWMYVS